MQMQRRMHTMLRVGDMQRSIYVYTQVLNIRVLRTFEQPNENDSLTFLGYGDKANICVLELTYNHGVREFDPGTGYGYIAIAVEDCYQACTDIRRSSGKKTRELGPLKDSDEIISFLTNPAGYQTELIQRRVVAVRFMGASLCRFLCESELFQIVTASLLTGSGNLLSTNA